MSGAPPSLLRRLLERALPEDVRDGIVGDLDEVYRTRRRETGAGRARLWYAGQTLAIPARFALEALREAAVTTGASLGLDLRLGLRMLVKYPLLTLVGGIAITVASAIGVGASEFVHDMLAPSLPLDEGDRIVRLSHDDTEAGGRVPPSLWDLEVWRTSLSSVEELGAYTTREQGIVTDRGEAGSVSLARITPAGFQTTRVPPQLGRGLVESDAEPGAEPVVVLGWEVWRTLLGGDPDPVGRTVRLGGTPTTVVGVMPEGYGFPLNQDAWAPLRVETSGTAPESAPRASVFGRLAPGATLASARNELEVAGRRAAADHPGVYERLRPRVDPFASRATTGQLALALSGVGLLFAFLLVVACANVATLVFARTVIREGEISVRRALGASRTRIVLQLFAEALVLVGGATLLGMGLARWALAHIRRLFFIIQQEPQAPFWWDDALSPTTLLYAAVLVVVGSFMVGVVPALKATGGSVGPRLGRSGRGGGLRLGGVWTVIIVLQVALTVAFLPLGVSQASLAFQDPDRSEFPADAYVTAQLGLDPAVPPGSPEERAAFLERSGRLFREVRDRVAADPAVRGAALASGLSAMNHLRTPVELTDGRGGAPVAGYARVLLVDPSYLALMGAQPVAGQPFGPGDFARESRAVVVNQAFVDQLLSGRNPVGSRLRFPEQEGESSAVAVPAEGSSMEVVGVVQDPAIDDFGPGVHPAVYAPLELAPVTPEAVGLVGMPQAPSTQLFVRLAPEAPPLAGRLHGLVSEVDAGLRLTEVGTAAEAWRPVHTGARLAGWVFMAVAAIVLMLSIAGIYALMSFTVSRRTREIAIRTAVGASRGSIVRIVFRRAVLQLLGGVILGSLVAVPVLWDGVVDDGPRSLVVVAALLFGAGMAACLPPVRRALAVDAAAAMKAE